MTDVAHVRARVRLELGDRAQPFRDTFRGTGDLRQYQMAHINISSSSVVVTKIDDDTATLQPGVDYTVDDADGYLLFPTPLEDGAIVLVEGTSYGMLSDEEIDTFVREAALQHLHDRRVTVRYRSREGFIRYADEPMTLATLPEVEEHILAILAAVESLWALSTDASTDIDISAPDGTQVPRGQRYAQLLKQIDVLTGKYDMLCQQLNVGLGRIEVTSLRRTSRLTGRLVPVFAAKEFDDHSLPTRLLPEIDASDIDDSGVPTPVYPGWGGY